MKLVSLISLFLISLLVSTSLSSRVKEAEEVIEGILVGAFGDVGHEVVDCIQDGEEVFKDIEEAIKDFEAGGLANVAAGLAKIGAALELLPDEVKDCGAAKDVVKDIEKIAKEFKNPEELIVKIGEEILWHGKSIYKDVTGCVEDFKEGKYEPAGEEIGDIIKIIFLDGTLRDDITDVEDFLEGFFKGALEDESVEINDCITDVADLLEEFETIIEDIKEGGFISDIEQTLLDFIDLITDSVRGVAQCEKTPAEIDILLDWAEEMKDLSKMETKLFNAFLYYPDRIKEDFKDAIDSFEDHSYDVSGFSLGDLLHLLFVEVNEKPSLVSQLIENIK